mmetsp:Transcript_9573/g.17450  ORF Transcript_9573/g.17450 Transcript_9573/m.17450 type:complete len:239 (-) Transcript_9573:727-1443(-)
MRAEGCTCVGSQFSNGSDCPLLDLQKCCSDMPDKISAFLVFIIRVIKGAKLSRLFRFFRRLNLTLVRTNHLNQMRYQIGQCRRKLFFHDLGEVCEDSVCKFMQVRRVASKTLTGAFHRNLKVWTKSFTTNGNRHMSHAFQCSATKRIQPFFCQGHALGHKRCNTTYVWSEFFFSSDSCCGQGSHGHLLNTSFVCAFEHGSQFLDERIQKWPHCFWLQTLAKHFQNITRGGLNGYGLIV